MCVARYAVLSRGQKQNGTGVGGGRAVARHGEKGRPMLSQRRTDASTTHTQRMTPTTEHMRIVRCIDSCACGAGSSRLGSVPAAAGTERHHPGPRAGALRGHRLARAERARDHRVEVALFHLLHAPPAVTVVRHCPVKRLVSQREGT